MYHDNLTILIQGPLDLTSINAIKNYKQFGKVVVSSWKDMNVENLEHLLAHKNIKTVLKEMPDINDIVGADKKSTFYYALTSMYNGLKETDTEFVLKTRSDEFYGNLFPFLESMENDKIICGNIFVRNDASYHFGDHIFLCKTKYLLKGVEELLKCYTKKKPLQSWMIQGPHIAETILCKSILKHMNLVDSSKFDIQIGQKINSQAKETFLNNIEIIDINRCSPFTASWGSANKKYINNFSNHHRVRDNYDYRS